MAGAAPAERWIVVEACGCCGSTASAPAGHVGELPLRRCIACQTLRSARIVDPEVLYAEGYHTGEHDFGWDTERDEPYELALADGALGWVEKVVKPGRLLDVGGGLGHFGAAAERRGWTATLLEPVAAATRHAEERYGLDTVTAGVEALDGSRQWELVAMSHTLEHLLQPVDILQRLRSVVAPGGALYIEVPNAASAARRLQGDRWWGWRIGEHVHHFTMPTLTELLDRAGYEVISRRTFVPGWDGLIPQVYAHWLGLEPLLNRVVAGRRRAAGGGAGDEAAGRDDRTEGEVPPPIRDHAGMRGLVYGPGFRAVARIEEAAGLGTNLRVVARPRP